MCVAVCRAQIHKTTSKPATKQPSNQAFKQACKQTILCQEIISTGSKNYTIVLNLYGNYFV